MSMDVIKNKIDPILRELITEDKIKLYSRWSEEYKKRILDRTKIHREQQVNLPYQNSSNPGFERQLISLFFNELKDKDAHYEWPYKSYINQSDDVTDIVYLDTFHKIPFEIWLEIGMYASEEKKNIHEILKN